MSRWPARLASWFVPAALACALTGASSANDATSEILQGKHGLTRLNDRLWVLPLELELRSKLAELPKQREHLVTVEKDLDGLVERNQRAWDESRPAVAVLKQSLARLSSADPQRELIDRQIKALEAGAREPRRLGGRTDARSLIVALASGRCELLAAIAWIRESVPALQDRYLELRSDAELAEALRGIGEGQRLGPQRSYKSDLQRLHEYERLAATAWLPTFEQGGQTRFTALIEERSPVTFSWVGETQQPLVLTASAAEAAGIKLASDAIRETIRVGSKREVTATRVTLGYLRLGSCVLRGERAYVLPPEAEDVGNRLGRSALAGRRVRFEPERLRMWIDES